MLISRIIKAGSYEKYNRLMLHNGESWTVWSVLYTRMNWTRDSNIKTIHCTSLWGFHLTASSIKASSFWQSSWELDWILLDSSEDWAKSQREKVSQTGGVRLVTHSPSSVPLVPFLAFLFRPSIPEVKPRGIPKQSTFVQFIYLLWYIETSSMSPGDPYLKHIRIIIHRNQLSSSPRDLRILYY